MEVINSVKFRNALLSHVLFCNLKSDIIHKVKELIPELEKIRLSSELTALICNLIENLYVKTKGHKVDKMKLCTEILDELYPDFNSDEKIIINEQIQYIYDNKLIVKVAYWKKVYSLVKRLVKNYLP